MALRETRMGYIPPSLEEMARADYDILVFAMLRSLYGKCTRHCQWLLDHDCSQGCCALPPFHKGVCICAPCRTQFSYRLSQGVARRDGNTLLDEWEDTVQCNERWRKKYPRIYDKAESLSTACSEQSIADDRSLMVVLQEEDNLIANYANDRAPSESSDNSSDIA